MKQRSVFGILGFLPILFFHSVLLFSQSYALRIEKVIDEKGDDPGATFAIAQDSIGFMWFGTVDGLYRYDGYAYHIFRHEKHNTNSLAGNTIRAMIMGRDNKLWIGTQGNGLDCFDLTHRKFYHYTYHKNQSNGISGNDIWSLATDNRGNIWIGAVGKQIDMFDIATHRFRHYSILPPETAISENITIRAIYQDRLGIIWIGMVDYGLTALNPRTGEIHNYRFLKGKSGSLASNEVRSIFEDHKGQLWVACFGGGLNRYNRLTDSFIRYNHAPSNPNSLISDLVCSALEVRNDEFWIGTEYGLSVWNQDKSTFRTYQHHPYYQNSLCDNRIRTIYRDKNGILWIGTEAGVDKIVRQHNFRIYKNIPGTKNSLPPGIVRCILKDRAKNLWMGVIDKGLIKYSPRTGKFNQFIHHKSDRSGPSGMYLTALFQDSQGNLWIGDWDSGLDEYNERTGTFKLIAGTRPGLIQLTDTRIQFIKEAKPGVLWIGTENGLNRLNLLTHTCRYYLHNEGDINSLSGNSLQSNAFVQDSAGNVWIGTWSNGLNYIRFTGRDQTQPVFTHWKANPNVPNQLNNNNIISLHLDGSVLWIGTFGGGLSRFDIASKTFKHYTTQNGLPNNIIFSILEDNQHNLWLSTDHGISKFDPEKETFQNFVKNDGLQDNHFFWGASFKANDDELFFGGINGLNSFYPSLIKTNTQIPVPVITDFKVFESSFSTHMPYWKLSKIDLPYTDNFVTLDFSSLMYASPQKIKYMIKMDGLDPQWHTIGNRRTVSYSNLSPGEYLFRVKAFKNNNITGSSAETLVRIDIHPPWWNTWIARTLYLFLLSGGILAFYFIRVGILKSQKRKLEDLVSIRTREIHNQKEELVSTLEKLKDTQRQLVESEKMASLGVLTAGVAHEINNPLNFIQGGITGLESILEEQPELYHNSDIQEEITNYLDGMKTGIERMVQIVTSLNHFNRQTDNLDQLCDIHAIIENCLQILDNQIKYKIEIQKEFTTETPLILGNEGKLHQLFLNILINSIHAIDDSGLIRIKTTPSNHYFKISIQDNGQGISKVNLQKIFDPFFTTKEAGKGTGLGLSIAYGIVMDHKGSIEYFSEEGQNTEAVILLPQKKKL